MKFLIIQTAFLGDVILATSVVEKLRQKFHSAEIDFLLRQGNEDVLEKHPFIREVIVLDKRKDKLRNLLSIAEKVRSKKYDFVINLQRFGSSGFIAWRSGAKEKIGFGKNPFSFCYTTKVKHRIGTGLHETERNHELIKQLTDTVPAMPKLYPTEKDRQTVTEQYGLLPDGYACIAPASVWHTKQFPKEKWMELTSALQHIPICLIGGQNDIKLCEEIKTNTPGEQVHVFAGKLSLLQTAALMKNARMNYVNDSAPLHMASAMNAPVTGIFCSTVPAFGFGPLSDNSNVVETREKLDCRPCGLHGHPICPKGHFKCAHTISIKDILNV